MFRLRENKKQNKQLRGHTDNNQDTESILKPFSIDYMYDQKIVKRVEHAKYYRRVAFLLIEILPTCMVIEVLTNVFVAPLLKTLYGIGLFCGWSLGFIFLGYLLRRIEKFTVQHRYDTIRIINNTIYWFDQSNERTVSVEISKATIDYCYYAFGSTIFNITDKKTGNTIYFSTDMSRYEEILKRIDPDYDWSAMYD
jgi:hypothetical protein